MKKILHKLLVVMLLAILSSENSFSYSDNPKSPKPLTGSDYYWIGNSGNFRDLSHWSSTSGGTADKSILPGFEDNVYFDANSFTLPGQIVTIQDLGDANGADFLNMDWTGVTNTPTFRIRKVTSPWVTSHTNGSLIFDSNMILDFDGAEFEFSGDGSYAIDTKGLNMGADSWLAINFTRGLPGSENGNGTASLLSPLFGDYIYIAGGTFNSNGYDVYSPGYFWLAEDKDKTANLGSSEIITDEFYTTGNGILTLNGNYSIIVGGIIWCNDGTSLNRVVLTEGNRRVLGSMTYNKLVLQSGKATFQEGKTQTFSELIVEGTGTTINSNLEGSVAYFVKTGPGDVNVEGVTLQDNSASGATFTATDSYSLGNVNGWNFPCEVPTGLTVNPGELTNTSAILRWDDISTTGGYQVQWKPTIPSVPTESFNTPMSITGLVIGALTPGQQYKFRVKSLCDPGASPDGSIFSDWSYFTTTQDGCETPDNLNVTNLDFTSVTLNWTGGANDPSTTYEVQYKPTISGVPLTTVDAGTNLSLGLTLLTPGQQYKFKVKAYCTADGNIETGFSPELFFTTNSAGCATPSGLTNGLVDGVSAQISWSGDGPDYEVDYKPTINGVPFTTMLVTASSSTTLTGLVPGQQYKYRVKGLCDVSGVEVESAYSAFGYVTTTTDGCSVPTGLDAPVVTTNSATIDWDDVAPGQDYEVQYKAAIPGTPLTNQLTGGPNSLNLPGLTPGQLYKYRVRSVCSFGGGTTTDYSGFAYFTTDVGGTTQIQVNNQMGTENAEEADIIIEEGLAIFPNPSRDYVNIKFTPKDQGSGTLIIYTLAGSRVSEQVFEDRLETTLSLRQSGSGMYIGRIIYNDRVYEEKIIVK